MTAYRNLEAAIATAVTELRRDLHGENYLDLAIYISGRVEDDVKVEFRLSKGYGSDEVKAIGGRLQPVVDEYLHRSSFNQRNAPLCLPNVAQPSAADLVEAGSIPEGFTADDFKS